MLLLLLLLLLWALAGAVVVDDDDDVVGDVDVDVVAPRRSELGFLVCLELDLGLERVVMLIWGF